jgi:hypothetical protein
MHNKNIINFSERNLKDKNKNTYVYTLVISFWIKENTFWHIQRSIYYAKIINNDIINTALTKWQKEFKNHTVILNKIIFKKNKS